MWLALFLGLLHILDSVEDCLDKPSNIAYHGPCSHSVSHLEHSQPCLSEFKQCRRTISLLWENLDPG